MATENCPQNVNHWRILPLKVGISSLGSFTILVSVDGFERDMTADVGGFTVFL